MKLIGKNGQRHRHQFERYCFAMPSVIPHFKKNRYGKIFILSGGGATKPMPYLSAYAASKAAVVRFAETLQKK